MGSILGHVVYSSGKPEGFQIRRCQGLAVDLLRLVPFREIDVGQASEPSPLAPWL